MQQEETFVLFWSVFQRSNLITDDFISQTFNAKTHMVLLTSHGAVLTVILNTEQTDFSLNIKNVGYSNRYIIIQNQSKEWIHPA